MTSLAQVRASIRHVVNAIKVTLTQRAVPLTSAQGRRLAMQIEGVSFSVNELRHDNGLSDELATLANIISQISDIIENPEYARFFGLKKPKVIDVRSTEKPLDAIVQATTLKRSLLMVSEVVLSYLDQHELEASPSREADADTLKRIVPAQKKLSPATFDIVDGRLVIVEASSAASLLTQGSSRAARDLLIENGASIINQLLSSNFDKRIVENIQGIQERLVSGTNVIQLGMLNIGCGLLVGALSEELPDSLAATIKAHQIGVNMYVSQFQDWKRFVAEAIEPQLSESDIAGISKVATEMVAGLAAAREVVDPNVPATINAIKQFAENPGESGKKVAYAIMTTIENFVSVVFKYGISFVDQTMSKTIDKTSTTIAGATAAALLAVALTAATSIGHIAEKMPESAWISRAAEIFQRHIGPPGKD